jgi:hypothetical protein
MQPSPILFVSSPSPGAVFRVLERCPVDSKTPASVFLSDALNTNQWRALFTLGSDGDWFDAVFPRLVLAFPPGIFRLNVSDAVWDWKHDDGRVVTASVSLSLPKATLWQRLTRQSSPIEAWARSHNLPIVRARVTLPTIDYEIVARLDQRQLLEETHPCLYQFSLSGSSGTLLD